MTAAAPTPGPRARRWAAELAAWAIPPEILAAAPESPWGFRPSLMRAPDPTVEPLTPSQRRALEELPRGGTLLDVGAGAGAYGLPVAATAGAAVVAVDTSEEMLAALAARADDLGVRHRVVTGVWPEMAGSVGSADVVGCAHVLYNVADLVPFARALTDHARRRVVVEITTTHPLTSSAPLWRHFHNVERPEGPTWFDARGVLEEAGLQVAAEVFSAPPRPDRDRGEWVAFVRRRLCLPADRDPEVDALLAPDHQLGPREVVALWWPGTAGAA